MENRDTVQNLSAIVRAYEEKIARIQRNESKMKKVREIKKEILLSEFKTDPVIKMRPMR